MGFLRSACRVLALSPAFFASAVEATDSGLVEVDVIFPRNETFAPSALTPLVFAVQNPQLLGNLSPRISYTLEQANDSIAYDDRIRETGHTDFSAINSSSPDPYLEYTSTSSLLNTEGLWYFSWNIDYKNCSQVSGKDTTNTTSNQVRDGFYFTTKNGSSEPDLAAATDDSTCEKSLNYAWNVTGLLDAQDRSYQNNSCAVISSPTPTSDPCKVKINATAASSISAALTATACVAASPKVSCPAAKNAAPGLQLPVGGAWLMAVVGGFAYMMG